MKTAIAPLHAATEAHLAALGERLRLARMRRHMGVDALAAAAGVSRGTVFRVEKGSPGVAMGAYARVMEALGLAADFALVAQADPKGRQLQDELLTARRAGTARARAGELHVVRESAEALWAFKRENQRKDIATIQEGRSSNEAMSWFSGGRAKRARIVGEPL